MSFRPFDLRINGREKKSVEEKIEDEK